MKKNSFIEGTFVATLSIIFIKILGALYVIPFYSIIGSKGGTLYAYAYNIYNLFLNISISGLPIAVSKIITEYNSKKMYKAKEKSFKIAKIIMIIISFMSFIIVFFFSNQIAYLLIGTQKGGNTLEEIGLVIKSVSFCLLIIPFLSVTRGYFQAHKYVTITSVSQIIEQIIRIFIILGGAYLAINIFKFNSSISVSIAISGAFFGGLIAYIFLKNKLHKNTKLFLKKDMKKAKNVPTKKIIKKIIKYSVPLVVISVVTDLYSLTDMALIIRCLYRFGYTAIESETIASIITTWGQKICMIITSVSLGITSNIIPHIVSSFVQKDLEEVNKKFTQAISIMVFIGLPITLFISFYSDTIYYLFYNESLYGGLILKYLPFAVFLSGLYLVFSIVLQSINKYKVIYISTFIGLFTNAILDIPLMYIFHKLHLPEYYGAITATIIGYLVLFSISIFYIKKEKYITFKPILKILYKMIYPISVILLLYIVLQSIIPVNKNNIAMCIIHVIILSSAYTFVSLKTKIIYEVLGYNCVKKLKKIIIKRKK